MVSYLNNIDTQLFLYLNSLHTPLLDPIMLFLSYNKFMMGGLIVMLISLTVKKYKKRAFIAVLFAIVAFGLSDSISSRIFKPGFERLRPCHQKVLEDKVHLAGKKCWGGKFGFVSSHAANSFAIATFFFLILGKNWYGLLFLHAGMVSYSRIYLAKHFPGDILAGAILGLLCGFASFKLWKLIQIKYFASDLK